MTTITEIKERVDLLVSNSLEDIILRIINNTPETFKYLVLYFDDIKGKKLDKEFNMLTIIKIIKVDDDIIKEILDVDFISNIIKEYKDYRKKSFLEQIDYDAISEMWIREPDDNRKFSNYYNFKEWTICRIKRILRNFFLPYRDNKYNNIAIISLLETDKNLFINDNNQESDMYIGSLHNENIKIYLDKRFGNILNMYKELGVFEIPGINI